MKIRPVGTELFHTDGRTDGRTDIHDEANSRFSHSAHTHHRSIICRQSPTTHIISTFEPLYVISINYRLSFPDDGSFVIRNMLE